MDEQGRDGQPFQRIAVYVGLETKASKSIPSALSATGKRLSMNSDTKRSSSAPGILWVPPSGRADAGSIPERPHRQIPVEESGPRGLGNGRRAPGQVSREDHRCSTRAG